MNLWLLPRAAAEVELETKNAATYKIIFQGNAAMSEAALRRDAAAELEAFDKEGHRPADIDDAAFQMQIAYRKAGYAFATVDYQIEKTQEMTTVTFVISEGPRVIVRDIILVGNKAFDDDVLKAYFEKDRVGFLHRSELVFVRSDVESAVEEIRRHYITHGYLDAVVEPPELQFSADRSQVDVAITITEGVQYTVHRINFRGDVLSDVQSDLDKIRRELIGQPYFNRRRLLLKTGILEIYGNYGYPDAVVEIDRQSTGEPGQVVLDATINSGRQITIAAIEIRGHQRTRPDFIRNRIRLKPGDRYNLALQKQSFRDLYRTGIFSKVDFELSKTEDPAKRVLVVVVEETKGKELFFEPGWGSYEKLRLRVGFQEKNLFGTGRIFRTQATGSIKARTLGSNVSDPFFLNTDIKADLTAFYNHRQEPSFTREDIGMSFGLSKYLTENLLSSGEYMIRSTDLTNVDKFEEQSEGTYNFASLKGQVNYDTRNDIFFPTTGQRIFVSAEQASGFLGSDLNLTRLTGGGRMFFRLAQNTVLGARYTGGFLIPGRGEVTLPLSERFFNGGENTVRSFKESELGPKDPSGDPVGGYGFNVINLELRQRLIGNLIGSVFFDYGNIAPNRSREEEGKPRYDSRSDVISDTRDDFFKDFRPAVGFGLQYLLPVGPARFDFAFNPDHKSERDEDFFVFHFSVGTAF
ncbi:MAG: outer membrane protein assembly factor BamA [Desulfobacterales bacterium]|nr:MAG: outer membrane protein assembly factor BamA [Desulfobacterales bacterium]